MGSSPQLRSRCSSRLSLSRLSLSLSHPFLSSAEAEPDTNCTASQEGAAGSNSLERRRFLVIRPGVLHTLFPQERRSLSVDAWALQTYSTYAGGRLWEATRALCSKAVDNIPSAVVASFVSRFSANAPTSCNGTVGWSGMPRRRPRPSRLPRL